jgi:hypothetical protein
VRDVFDLHVPTPKLDGQCCPFPAYEFRGSGLAGYLDDLGRGCLASKLIPSLPLVQRSTDGGEIIRRELGASDQ